MVNENKPNKTTKKPTQKEDKMMVKEEKPKETEKTPKDWLEPKIFKGTSVN